LCRSSASVADVAKLTTPLTAALDAADQKLLRAPRPAKTLPDLKLLVVAESAVIADLDNVSNQTVGTFGTCENQISVDFGKLSAQISIVRADLGLPPSK
jgi:hypothetical protein